MYIDMTSNMSSSQSATRHRVPSSSNRFGAGWSSRSDRELRDGSFQMQKSPNYIQASECEEKEAAPPVNTSGAFQTVCPHLKHKRPRRHFKWNHVNGLWRTEMNEFTKPDSIQAVGDEALVWSV